VAQDKQDKVNEWDSFLAAVDAKITALQALRASYVTAVSLGAFGGGGDLSVLGSGVPSGPIGAPLELPRGALLGKSLPAAITLYLSAVKQKKTIREIATALKDGGVESTSGNFENIVTGALNRLKRSGQVLRFKDGWSLAEFYPDNLRAKFEAAAEAKPKKKAAKNGKAKRSATKSAEGRRADATAKSKADMIIEFLTAHQGTAYSSSDLAAAVKLPAVGFGIVLMHMQKAGKIQKLDDGTYRAA